MKPSFIVKVFYPLFLTFAFITIGCGSAFNSTQVNTMGAKGDNPSTPLVDLQAVDDDKYNSAIEEYALPDDFFNRIYYAEAGPFYECFLSSVNTSIHSDHLQSLRFDVGSNGSLQIIFLGDACGNVDGFVYKDRSVSKEEFLQVMFPNGFDRLTYIGGIDSIIHFTLRTTVADSVGMDCGGGAYLNGQTYVFNGELEGEAVTCSKAVVGPVTYFAPGATLPRVYAKASRVDREYLCSNGELIFTGKEFKVDITHLSSGLRCSVSTDCFPGFADIKVGSRENTFYTYQWVGYLAPNGYSGVNGSFRLGNADNGVTYSYTASCNSGVWSGAAQEIYTPYTDPQK